MSLRTDYKNDELNTAINTERQFEEVTNPNGTKSYHDVTDYSQVGDSFDAGLVNAQNTEINAKAPIDSPAFTGNPTAPTQSQSTADDTLATTAFVNSALKNFIDPNLRTSGKAADAQATGNKINALQNGYNSLSNSAFEVQGWLTDGTNLDDVIVPGIYAKSVDTTVLNEPEGIGTTSYIFVVLTHRPKGTVSENNFKGQILITAGNRFYFRQRSTDGWGNWKEISNSEVESRLSEIETNASELSNRIETVSNASFSLNGWLASGTDLNDITIPGIYAKSVDTTVLNEPEGIGTTSYIFVVLTHRPKGTVSENNFKGQILITAGNRFYFRQRSTDGWGSWSEISNTEVLSRLGIVENQATTLVTDVTTLKDSVSHLNNNSIETKGWLTDGTNLDDVIVPGIYAKSVETTVLNEPDGIGKTSYIFVVLHHRSKNTVSENNFKGQILITAADRFYFRQRGTDGWIDWKEITNGTIVEKIGAVETAVADLDSRLDVIENKAFTLNGWLADGTDLNDVIDAGVYAKSYGDNVLNEPSGLSDSYVLLVLHHRTRDVVGAANNFKEQIIFTTGGKIYARQRNTERWQDWFKISNDELILRLTVDENKAFTLNGWLADGTDLNDVIDPGIYAKSVETVVLNAPSRTNETSYLLVVLHHRTRDVVGAANNFKCQIIITASNEFFIRQRGTNGWRDWSSGGAGTTRFINEKYNQISSCIYQAKRSWKPASGKMFRGITVSEEEPKELTTTYYDENETYNIIPYGMGIVSGLDVLYDRNLATFFSAVKNPASILYMPPTEKEIEFTEYAGSFWKYYNYGSSCGSFCLWIMGIDTWYQTGEMDDTLIDYYDYKVPEDIEIGDVMTMNRPGYGHIRMISGINMRTSDYVLDSFVVAQQGNTHISTHSPQDVEDMFLPENDGYKIGRWRDPHFHFEKAPKFAVDVIADMGNNTFYYQNDEVWLYIPDGDNLYWKKDNGNYTYVAKSSLNTKVVNDVTVYDATSIMSTPGKYYFTTDLNSKQACELYRINTGNITISGNTATLSGYSSDYITPLYYRIVTIYQVSNHPSPWPAPEGYYANVVKNSQTYINGDTFEFTVPTKGKIVEGYYLIVYFENEFGKPRAISNFVIY